MKKNRMLAIVDEVSPMNYEIRFELEGNSDGLKWVMKNNQSTRALDIWEKAKDGDVVEIMYDSKAERYINKISELKDLMIVKVIR